MEGQTENTLENQIKTKLVRFRMGGRQHTVYDPRCAGCESVAASARWPRPHHEFGTSTCLGLVHAERFTNPASQESNLVIWCDVCGVKPDASV